jgi:vacuolar-type H+-ATPase subunit I/STV1
MFQEKLEQVISEIRRRKFKILKPRITTNMRKKPEIEDMLKDVIRDELAKNPLASVQEIRTQLYRYGYHSVYQGQLDWHYISKLIHKVRIENIARLSTEDRHARWAAVRERHRFLTKKLMAIAASETTSTSKGDGRPTIHDQIEAANTIMKWDAAMLCAEAQIKIMDKTQTIEKKHTRAVIMTDTISETRMLAQPNIKKVALNHGTYQREMTAVQQPRHEQ